MSDKPSKYLKAALGGTAAALGGLAAYDLTQTKYAVLRNYPVLGHMRYLLSDIGPELRQYFIERNWDGRPFSRDQRDGIYARARGEVADGAFGTVQDVHEEGTNTSCTPSPRSTSRASRRAWRSAARTAPSRTRCR